MNGGNEGSLSKPKEEDVEQDLLHKHVLKIGRSLLVEESVAVGVAHRVRHLADWTLLELTFDELFADADSVVADSTVTRHDHLLGLEVEALHLVVAVFVGMMAGSLEVGPLDLVAILLAARRYLESVLELI